MIGAVVLLTLLPALVRCAGDGNVRLLEDEINLALKSCSYPTDSTNAKETISAERQRRSENSYDGTPKIDDNTKHPNQYSHERRNINDTRDEIQNISLNITDYDVDGNANSSGNAGEKLSTSVSKPASFGDSNVTTSTKNIVRSKRSEPLLNKGDSDQCLSQCVFANLQVVDSRGIPREAELWNKVQSSVTSQQSRIALRDQIRACFQELQSEAEDNGCSYSNKLERCLMLRFSNRKSDPQIINEEIPPSATQ